MTIQIPINMINPNQSFIKDIKTAIIMAPPGQQIIVSQDNETRYLAFFGQDLNPIVDAIIKNRIRYAEIYTDTKQTIIRRVG